LFTVIDCKIYLIHQTAKEFLVSNTDIIQPSSLGIWKHSLQPRESNLTIATICISYLLFSAFETNPLVIDDQAEDRMIKENVYLYTNQHHFLDYSAKHWNAHLQEAKVKEMAIWNQS
jgi:hypothetical protein